MRRCDATFVQARRRENPESEHLKQRDVQGPGFLNAERPRTGSGPLPPPLSVFQWQQLATLSRFLYLIFESDRRSDKFKAAHFVNMNVVSDCDFSMSLFFMDTESFIMLI